MNKIRVIGDAHGKINSYLKIANKSKYSVQLGDLSFNYNKIIESGLNTHKHKFIGGNHDNYDDYNLCPYSLGDFGNVVMNGIEFFFLRGSSSIDAHYRVKKYLLDKKKTWWYQEELSDKSLQSAYELYCESKPEIMMSHDCPESIKNHVPKNMPTILKDFGLPEDYSCTTQHVLQKMFEAHQPKIWLFGHYHVNFTKKINNTNFLCIDELNYVDLVKNPLDNDEKYSIMMEYNPEEWWRN